MSDPPSPVCQNECRAAQVRACGRTQMQGFAQCGGRPTTRLEELTYSKTLHLSAAASSSMFFATQSSKPGSFMATPLLMLCPQRAIRIDAYSSMLMLMRVCSVQRAYAYDYACAYACVYAFDLCFCLSLCLCSYGVVHFHSDDSKHSGLKILSKTKI